MPYLVGSYRPWDMGWGVRRRGGLYSKQYGYDEHFEGSLGSSANSSTLRSNREQRWIAQRYGENVGCVFCSEGIENGCQGSSPVVRIRRSSPGHRAPSVSGCVRFAPQVGYHKDALYIPSGGSSAVSGSHFERDISPPRGCPQSSFLCSRPSWPTVYKPDSCLLRCIRPLLPFAVISCFVFTCHRDRRFRHTLKANDPRA